MEIEAAKAVGRLTINPEVCSCKRASAAGILLMTFGSLRFADVQRLETFEVNNDSVHGTLLCSKTKKPHGLNWPWTCPRAGITGSTEWDLPLVHLRTAYKKINGRDMSYSQTRPQMAVSCRGSRTLQHDATEVSTNVHCPG